VLAVAVEVDLVVRGAAHDRAHDVALMDEPEHAPSAVVAHPFSRTDAGMLFISSRKLIEPDSLGCASSTTRMEGRIPANEGVALGREGRSGASEWTVTRTKAVRHLPRGGGPSCVRLGPETPGAESLAGGERPACLSLSGERYPERIRCWYPW
jgi:hypothetical protein